MGKKLFPCEGTNYKATPFDNDEKVNKATPFDNDTKVN
jgi:hypothetical protein